MEKTHGITLRVVGWPDDGRPGVSTDPQAELNRQFSDFDVYIGMLGSKFGSPTPRAGSGTEEEFESAMRRFQNDSTSERVLFYFMRTAADPYSIDADQLKRVQQFRETLPSRGVVYRDFHDTASFTNLVQDHLYSIIEDDRRGDRWSAVGSVPSLTGAVRDTEHLTHDGAGPAGASEVDVSLSKEDGEDESGFLDHVVAFHEAVAVFTAIVGEMRHDMDRINEQVRARATEGTTLNEEFKSVKHVGGSRAQQEFASKARMNVDGAQPISTISLARRPGILRSSKTVIARCLAV